MVNLAKETNAPKRIPYGISDYGRLRRENAYYVDKTHYIPQIEAAPFYLFCIRPRRCGKSLWLSVLQHYYDVNRADDFDEIFGDTYIGQNPTPDRNSYLVIFINFSLVNPKPAKVEQSFESNGSDELSRFLRRYERFFTEKEIDHINDADNVEAKLRRIFACAEDKQLKIYLIIDEYDNFTNTILTTHGEQAYREITQGAGFFRYIFNLLKGATGGQIAGLTRLFITGVSPVTMDDVTSGFNIGTNISLRDQFNEMIGFTEDEVLSMLMYYERHGLLPLGVDESLQLMRIWYNNYIFGRQATTSMYNADMVLYFLLTTNADKGVPLTLIDQNIRTDYTKLRHLMSVDRYLNAIGKDAEDTGDIKARDVVIGDVQVDDSETGDSEIEPVGAEPADRDLNGNFSILKTIIEEGEIVSIINPSFPLEELLNRENFISLLYYFGLLSINGTVEGQPLLRIPNRTVKDLMYGYMRSGFADANVFKLDVWTLSRRLSDMAYRGDWRPFFDYLSREIQAQASVRDHLNGEKVIQGFLIAYLNVTNNFLTWSEREMGGGFVDLYLEPFLEHFTDAKYGYLIELEYISNTKFEKKDFDKSLAAEKAEAERQLIQYGSDPRIQKMAKRVKLKKLMLIYRGWELVHAEEVD